MHGSFRPVVAVSTLTRGTKTFGKLAIIPAPLTLRRRLLTEHSTDLMVQLPGDSSGSPT